MINPITRLDQKLLTLATWFAKKINWWTGSDNFWTAKQCVCFTALCYLGDGLLFPREMIPAAALTLMICSTLFVCIIAAERNSEEAMLCGAKQIGDEIERFIARIGILIFFCFATYTAIKDTHEFRRYVLDGLLILGSASAVLACYLSSVDRPPLKRSQAWQWLKEKFTDLFLRPQPTPQPVPVHR